MRKLIKLVLALGLGVVVLVLLLVWLGLNSLVRRAVETGATTSLKVPTTLGSATLSPFGGSVGLSDLKVGSPAGFSSPQMFTLGHVGVSSSIGRLFGTPVRVVSVKVDGPQLVIEQAGGKLNVMALSENLKPKGEPAPGGDKAQPMKVVIDQLDIANAGVTIVPGIPGVTKTYQVSLPAVSLKNIGNADGTQTGEEIGRVVNEIISVMAAKAAESDQVPPEVRQLLSLDINQLKNNLEGKAKEELKKVTDKLGAGDLGKLLEKKKK
ncbi:MAG: hypothetical protein JWM57_3544 [Phycisphaerales bacterium]|nr:hypothetical protein [Phycisphaerales bacterium]